MSRLYQLRSEIDAIDAQIIILLAKRFAVVRDIGTYKKAHTIPCLDETRWKEVLTSNIAQGNQQGLSSSFVADIWDCIHKEALSLQ